LEVPASTELDQGDHTAAYGPFAVSINDATLNCGLGYDLLWWFIFVGRPRIILTGCDPRESD
jgi:hypothetical protein